MSESLVASLIDDIEFKLDSEPTTARHHPKKHLLCRDERGG